jgi:hypothetical protein
MKPFNLELAKQGKKVVDEQGRIGYYVGSIENPFSHIFAFDNTKPNQQFIALYNDYGLCAANPCYNKLNMATEKKTVWIAVSNEQFGTNRLATNACDSKEELLKSFDCGTVMSGQHQIVSFEIEV